MSLPPQSSMPVPPQTRQVAQGAFPRGNRYMQLRDTLGGTFASLDEAWLEVANYLDTYFNLDRRHSALGYRSPHQFERDCLTSLSQLTVRFHWTIPDYELEDADEAEPTN